MKTYRISSCAQAVLLACLVLGLSGCPCLGTSVFFPDPALRSALRLELRQPLGCITAEQLIELRELQLSGLGITNLSGLEFALNLETLDLSGNAIQSVTAIGNLNVLKWLDISSNNIENIEPLTGLEIIQVLNLSGNDIFDWGPLAALAANGLIAESAEVIVDAKEEENMSPSFQNAFDALIERGVTVTFAASSTAMQ